MKGQRVWMDSLLAHDVKAIFGNPGTTENPLLDALIDYPFQYYVALHEGIAVGAASFYAQATGKTGIVNLHVAPGLGNGIGMMYGALKANSPLIVTAGQQDTRMRLREPLLSHDLAAMAAPVTKWSAEPRHPDEIGPMLERAFRIAHEAPAGPVFMSLPVDVMSADTDIGVQQSERLRTNASATAAAIEELVDCLLAADNPALFVGDDVPRCGAVDLVVTLAETLGAGVWHEGLRAQISFPNRHPNYIGRIPFEAANIRNALKDNDLVMMIGGAFFEELWFDAGAPVVDTTTLVQLEQSSERLARHLPVHLGVVGELEPSISQLNDRLRQRRSPAYATAATGRNTALGQSHAQALTSAENRTRAHWEAQPMLPGRALFEVAAALPEQTIVVDESITASLEVAAQFDYRRAGDYFAGRGGGIGQGLAGAIGVQVGAPQRRVVAISGDGSAMYSIQALWSAAHHQLPIVFVILSNREYRVLKHNLDIYRQRFDADSNRPYPHMDLDQPVLGFVELARGMGVEGVQISDADEIGKAVGDAFSANAPRLIEILVSGKPD